MMYELLRASDSARWNEAVSRCRGADIYFTADYHHSFECNGDGEALGFLLERDETFFYPFFRRRIEPPGGVEDSEGWFDIETVYGYSGPLATTGNLNFLKEAWKAFDRYCLDSGVVAEFARFNPISANHELASNAMDVRHDRETVTVDLAGDEESFWKRYPSVQRNMVRKAEKRGLATNELDLSAGLPAFRKLYEETMERVRARDYYLFKEAYYDCIRGDLSRFTHLLAVADGEKTVASALFFRYSDRLHYHLSASENAYRSSGAVNLLLHSAGVLGRKMGCRWLHLGGGRTANSKDSLMAFKASISDLRMTFYTGRRIHNAHAYETLNARWLQLAGVVQRPDYFLLYRAPIPRK